MKKMLRHSRVVAVISLLILLMTSPAFAMQPITSISSSEAAQMALYYYCLNRPDDSLVTLDEYEVTPLYDKDGNITYYSVDFFYEGTPKGYVVISEDLNNFLCPEFNYDEASIYYQNALNDIETVYYNPFEVFMIDEETDAITTLSGEEIAEEDVGGTIVPGDLQNGIGLSQELFETDDPLTSREVFAEHPTEYLRSKDYTSVASTSTFGTIESAMDSAGAFNLMLPVPDGDSYELDDETLLFNAGHCTITAISNILMYWRSVCCSRYPANYEDMFSVVLQKAVSMGYFSNTEDGDGMSIEEAKTVIDAVNDSYNYNGVVHYFPEDQLSFSDIKTYINADWPIYFRFNTLKNTFDYSAHAVVLYGYNTVGGYMNGNYEEYEFIKFYSGHSSKPHCYVCFDMLSYYAGDMMIELEDGREVNGNINYSMFAFCPYTP